MPIFSALIGTLVFSAVMTKRAWLGVGAAALGVSLLLWHEFTGLAGRPVPNAPAAWAIGYNAVLIFGYAHAAWFYLARSLPPVASTLSVMFIPVLGVFSGAVWLGEVLHWQDWAAVLLVVVAIASVLWPAKETA